MDAAGLFDPAASGQLMILKNLEMQYRASGLHLKITLDLKQPVSPESLQNAIHDLGLNGITASKPPGHESFTQPKTRLVAPDGQVEREWHEFVGPAEIGLAIRGILGEPFYPGMEQDRP